MLIGRGIKNTQQSNVVKGKEAIADRKSFFRELCADSLLKNVLVINRRSKFDRRNLLILLVT